MPAMVENSSALPDPTKTTELSSVSDAHPYVLAIDQIRVAITRHREYRDSLEDLREHSDNVVEDSHKSQSPLGFTNGAQTIEDIERILEDLDRSHPPPKLTHGSSKIEEDLLSTVDDRGQIAAPPRIIEAPWTTQELAIRRTHPENFEHYEYHLDKLISFETDIMMAFNSSNKAQVKYTKVEALLLTWQADEDDDIREDVDADTEELLELFKEVNFTVTCFEIPRDPRKGWIRLQRQLSQFVEKYEDYQIDDVLFLVHYNGHGSIRNGKSYWHPTAFAARRSDRFDLTSEQNGPTIEYDDVRKIFDSVINQDILFILDCCYAGAASRSKGPGNTKELLAACGSEDQTPSKPSFTSRFVKCFREQLKTDPVFQVGWLFESITDISQKPTPLHVNLNKSRTSICLSSLAASEPADLAKITNELSNDGLSPGTLLGVDGPSSASSSRALSTFSDDNNVSDEYTSPTSGQGDHPPDHWNYEVLITVKLHGDVVPDQRGWHMDFPPNQVQSIKSVKVRSIVYTKSTLLLVTMPIRCWILLPDNPAYTFIDFVRTDSYLNRPEAGLEPIPSLPSPVIAPVERSDSDGSNKTPEHVHHIITAIQDFFENKHKMMEKPSPMRRITSKIGLSSSSLRFEDDPRWGYVRHLMQRVVVTHNEHDESFVSYDLHFREEKKLFERCKKHLIKEVLHNTGTNKNVLENKLTAELDKLQKDVLGLVEGDIKRPKIEPRVLAERGTLNGKGQTHNRQRSSISNILRHKSISEEKDITVGLEKPRTGSEYTISRIPRTDSAFSTKNFARADSFRFRNIGIESRPLSFLGRRLSRESGRSQSRAHSPRSVAHLSYPGMPNS